MTTTPANEAGHFQPATPAPKFSTAGAPQPGNTERVQRPTGPAATQPATPAASVKPAATPAAVVQPAPPVTHVLVPVATLQAIHATLSTHADTILGLLPATAPDAIAAANAAATLARLKQQAAAGK